MAEHNQAGNGKSGAHLQLPALRARGGELIRAVKGMNDILPSESARWEWCEAKVRALMARYGYANVLTPFVEPTALFVRGLGEVTDIV